jgi:hypothetical protein
MLLRALRSLQPSADGVSQRPSVQEETKMDDIKEIEMDEPEIEAPPSVSLAVRAALAWSAWRIRKKNHQAALKNNGTRVPLDSPLNKL